MAKSLINIHSPIADLHHVALRLQTDFNHLGIKTVADLLWYFPWRYDDLSQISEIGGLCEGQTATIEVWVKKIRTYRSARQKMLITELSAADASGEIKAFWFRQKYIAQTLKNGDHLYLSGKVGQKNGWQMINPVYEKFKTRTLHSARIVPIYHLSGRLTQKQLRFLINRALQICGVLSDNLPSQIVKTENFPDLTRALQAIHFPDDELSLAPAIQRLKFEELFYLQCKYQLARLDYQSRPAAALVADTDDLDNTIKSLPFSLSADQDQALQEVVDDLAKTSPMNRLLEGDVGSGKTIIAWLAASICAANSKQSALLAPTEILAWQHYQNIRKLMPDLAECSGLLTATQSWYQAKAISATALKQKIAQNKLKILIGTHALIQESVNFADLGLVIIDEQHRFGVRQRQALKNKNQSELVPHLLSMTATPIPRTLSLTLYGDLDISLIKNKPRQRQTVKTWLIPENKRAGAYQFIREHVTQGEQAFIICPLIDESDKLNFKSVKNEYQRLKNDIFPDLEIRLVHGQIPSEEKAAIMRDFQANKFPLLVATSVIEVGVDIPGATVMLIESAERFGLSQLHQLRGRVGRNDLPSFCFLFTSTADKLNSQRLQTMTKISDGFRLAEIDLELRGSGEIFGTQQTGYMPLRIAKLSDAELIKKAQTWAKKMLGNKKWQTLNQGLLKQLKDEMHLE